MPIDVMDRACADECPGDCIYEGGRALYIHPDECVDCGACEPLCPVEAIYYKDDLPEDLEPHLADDGPLGFPGGSLGVDTPLVGGRPSAARSDGA